MGYYKKLSFPTLCSFSCLSFFHFFLPHIYSSKKYKFFFVKTSRCFYCNSFSNFTTFFHFFSFSYKCYKNCCYHLSDSIFQKHIKTIYYLSSCITQFASYNTEKNHL